MLFLAFCLHVLSSLSSLTEAEPEMLLHTRRITVPHSTLINQTPTAPHDTLIDQTPILRGHVNEEMEVALNLGELPVNCHIHNANAKGWCHEHISFFDREGTKWLIFCDINYWSTTEHCPVCTCKVVHIIICNYNCWKLSEIGMKLKNFFVDMNWFNIFKQEQIQKLEKEGPDLSNTQSKLQILLCCCKITTR